ncbi:protein phosphatase 1 regulatory subunit 15A-like [Oryzias latipes]|uniref:Protein phosphatase 1, regulatory subunit 15B n=1 Tax=Oryzias latipes TaxID=8090 RepID=A0A3B3HCD2_ORYLA|nr:protein phosphatase 1 regulatory subunit 15A-like [Oryzias latipes]
MATEVSENGSQPTAMEKFGIGGGMALLPWTKQMLTVLWEQLRLLVQVIYYTFMSVFQMFRFEVHVRITDETGEHIQHMSSAANPSESFLFSSVVGGSNPLSNFCADVGDPFPGKSTAEALLSSLRADDLCCGLMDDLVSRTAGNEDGIFVGKQSTWKVGFPGDWNIFVSSSDSSCSNDASHRNSEKFFKADLCKERVFKRDTSEDDRSSHWSSEEEPHVVEFESEDTKALWESLSKSNDPYNPFFFSACISTKTDMGKSKSAAGGSCDADLKLASKSKEEVQGPPRLNMWLCRSDSESSWSSWAGSDCSSPDFDQEESDKLWELFSSPGDPYNPLSFSACKVTSQTRANSAAGQASSPAPPSRRDPDDEEKESGSPPSEDDEEELLWKSLSPNHDPYHPLNFQASFQTTPTLQLDKASKLPPTESRRLTKASKQSGPAKPALAERPVKQHSHPDRILVPWKRPPGQSPPEERKTKNASSKQVRFSPQVQVHVMRTWPFARQASRKGLWEEMARDRDRFRRRIVETEQAIGYCFSPPHRQKIQAYVEGALRKAERS